MLIHLSIRDLAIIDCLELPLGPGMTALTGETGAGKSILVDAISLLLGARARGDIIRTGADEAEVTGQFQLEGAVFGAVSERLREQGLPPCEEGALLVKRLVSRAGRHKQFLNGALATVSQLREVVEMLVDITGQHAHQALLRPMAQLDLLDAFGAHVDVRAEVSQLFKSTRQLVEERERLHGSEEEKIRQAEYLRYQIDEIRALDPKPGEVDTLAEERTRLMNMGRLRDAVARALEALTDGGDDALSRMQTAVQALARAGAHDSELGRLAEVLEEASVLVEDVGRSLSRRSGLEDDPERLGEVDDRLDSLKKLTRKHGGDIDAVLAACHQMERELDQIEHAEERLAALEGQIEVLLHQLTEVCARLTGKRRAAGRLIAGRVEAELKELGMGKARFEIAIEPLAASKDAALTAGTGEERRGLSVAGADRVEMRLAANPGEDPASLAKVASGGELSRVLLAVKRVLLERDPTPVTIFDEVDAGVGGAIGEAIGDKLRAISDGRQVLVITHLAQIAALAHAHLRVEKVVEGGRTSSKLSSLGDDERVEEIARMIGGREITEATRVHAAEMLARGHESVGRATTESAPLPEGRPSASTGRKNRGRPSAARV